MKPPRLRGRALTAIRVAAETPGTDVAIREIMKRSLGIDQLAALPASYRGGAELEHVPLRARAERRLSDEGLGTPSPKDWPRTAADYRRAYARGDTTPVAVAGRAHAKLAALSTHRPSMNLTCADDAARTRIEAEAAADRLQRGAALGPIDGVPFLVKDEYDVRGLPTRLGSRCEPETPVDADSTVVERLSRAGAVFLAKTVLTEWGMSPIGGNAHERMPHNAHDPTRAPGGSSTGSAVGVALGVGPFATAGDGGGSIRTPAALNGIFGIKPTFGRVSRAGDGFVNSVSHCGPVGASAADLATFLDVVCSEPDPRDPLTRWAPAPPSGGFGARLGAGVRGLRVGVAASEWSDASPDVEKAGRAALAALEKDGAFLVDVDLPLAKHAAKIGYLTIGPESLAGKLFAFREQKSKLGEDLRLAFTVLAGLSCAEHLDAQHLRTGLRLQVRDALTRVDVLALPTTAITAPPYDERDEGVSFSDPAALDGLCRFAFLGNLTGLPAASAPVGIDAIGLPVGFQIVGDAWDEDVVLGVVAHLERIEAARVLRPPLAIDLLA